MALYVSSRPVVDKNATNKKEQMSHTFSASQKTHHRRVIVVLKKHGDTYKENTYNSRTKTHDVNFSRCGL